MGDEVDNGKGLPYRPVTLSYELGYRTSLSIVKRELTLNLEVYDLLLKFIRFVSVRFETVTFVSIEAQKERNDKIIFML